MLNNEMSNKDYGRLTRTMISGASWSGRDDFPSSQEWCDFIEKLLAHIEAQSRFTRYLSRLRGKLSQRDGALAEIFTSFFFHRNRFKVIRYEPEAKPNAPLDLAIQWGNAPVIFVEVKSPDWRGELTESEKHGLRSKQQKSISGEARSVNPIERVQFEIDKALPKFFCTTPNLLVVVPDLFVSPIDLPFDLLVGRLQNILASGQNKKIGGILLLQAVNYGRGVEVEHSFVENLEAYSMNRLPGEAAVRLIAGNAREL